MSPNEYTYHELQKINEHLRRENHLLRLLDDLQHGAKGIYAPVNACVHTSQETPTEDAGDRSAGDESQGTLVGDVVQKMDVDAHGDKAEDQHKHLDEKEAKDGEKDDADEGKEDEVEENEKKKEEKEEEDEEDYEEEEYDDDDDDDVSTWISNCTDEDSKVEDEEDEKEVPEEFYIRELHHCNPRAHRNAVLSLFKRDVLELDCTTPIDNMHIDLHQNLEGCSSLQPLALGNCKFDASLYVASDANPYKRTDVWVYRLLYGLHPAVVLWIDYEPTLRLLEKHAEIKTNQREFRWNPDFIRLFHIFITVFEQAGCLTGYLEDIVDEHNSQGTKENVALAYKECVDALN